MTAEKDSKKDPHSWLHFKSALERARRLVDSKDQVYKLSREAVHKAGNHQRSLATVWSQFLNLIEMVRQWSRGAYPNVPIRTLIFSLAALIYFINPLDAIPDPIPFAGYIDDSMIIGLVLTAIQADLNRFNLWKERNKKAKMQTVSGGDENSADSEESPKPPQQ